jgi:hypothetical protein
VGGAPPGRRAAPRLHRGHARRRGHRRRPPVSACGRDRQRMVRGRALHRGHQPSGRAVVCRHGPLARGHRPAPPRPLLRRRQDHALPAARHRPADRRQPAGAPARTRGRHAGGHPSSPLERGRLRIAAGPLRGGLGGTWPRFAAGFRARLVITPRARSDPCPDRRPVVSGRQATPMDRRAAGEALPYRSLGRGSSGASRRRVGESNPPGRT